jgi:hypothetical protein
VNNDDFVKLGSSKTRKGCVCVGGGGVQTGIKIEGDLANVKYKLTMGAFELDVDWMNATGNGKELTKQQIDDSRVAELIAGYVGFNSVLANITGKDHCYGEASDRLSRDLAAAHANRFAAATGESSGLATAAAAQADDATWSRSAADGSDGCPPCDNCPPCPVSTRKTPPKVCNGTHGSGMSWGLVTCNENMHLAATQVRGVGGDSWWPPNQNRSWSADTMRGPEDKALHPACTDSFAEQGLYGGPQSVHSHGDWIAGAHRKNAPQPFNCNFPFCVGPEPVLVNRLFQTDLLCIQNTGWLAGWLAVVCSIL